MYRLGGTPRSVPTVGLYSGPDVVFVLGEYLGAIDSTDGRAGNLAFDVWSYSDWRGIVFGCVRSGFVSIPFRERSVVAATPFTLSERFMKINDPVIKALSSAR